MEGNRRAKKLQSPQIPFYALPPDKQSSSEILNKARKSVRGQGGDNTKAKWKSPGRSTPSADHHSASLDFVLTGAGMGYRPKSNNLGILPPVGKSATPQSVASTVASPRTVAVEDIPLAVMLQRHIEAMKEAIEKKYTDEEKSLAGDQNDRNGSTALRDRYERILTGAIEGNIPNVAKVVRIFVSSTFTDTNEERNALMYHAVPKLKTFCHERGYEFQVVDMRWGVSDGAANDHITLQLCLNEIKKCQNISTGPNFVSLLSHKYGYRPLPPTIGSDDFELMFSSVIDEEERALMTRWYKEDNNAVPSAYTLLSISSIIANFGHPSNRILAEKAKAEWWRAYEKLSDVITKASLSCIKDSITAHKYISSLTEKEVESGVVGVDNAPSCCLWLKREITGLSANDRNSTARAFIDQLDDKGTPNQTSQDLLQLLKNDRIPSALPQSNISDYSVPWKRGKIDPAVHSKSITNLCKTFQSRLEGMIERGIAEREQVHDALYEEVIQHASFCQQKCEAFHGRQDTLKRIESYVKSDSRQPMVIYGQSGCGKTSIVAMAATMVNKWLQGRCKLVLRFLGTTPDSTIIHLLLTTVCEQIVKSYNSNMVVPRGLQELREFLPQCLTLASAESQLVVFLDSLDQLDSQDAARQLSWLPRQLPSYVKIVVSTLPEEEHTCFPMLQGMIKEESLFVPVPQLVQDDAHDILQEWFKSAKRTLTTQQMDILTRGFEKCPLPLYLKLCFDEACRWRSFTPQDETNLEDTVRGVINCLFARIEREMGKVLVQRALGYLTAAKSGLSESEIEDILSSDDDVLNDVYQYWTPPTRRLPPLLWIRIRSALSSYLVERGADGSRVIYWYHRQFIEAARERYLSDERQKKLIHRGEADYFSGKWANGVKKSYVTRQGQKSEADRFVAAQPLAFTSTKYNLRKLNELPTHLIGSGNLKALKKDVLCNFDWLLTKIKATSFRQVMDDFRTATKAFPDDEDITRVKETLQLSEEGVILSPYQLPGQLLGRMPNEACNLLDMAAVGDVTAGLLPSHLCLTKAGGPLIHTMTGHTDKVSAMRITRNGQYVITGGNDQTVKIWSISDGVLVRGIENAGKNIVDIQLCHGERYIAVVSDSDTSIYKFGNGELLQRVEKISAEDNTRPMNIFSVTSRLFIVGFGYVKMIDFEESLKPVMIEGEVASELGNAPTVYTETLFAVVDEFVVFKDPTHRYFTIADTANHLALVRRARIFQQEDEERIRLLTSTHRGEVLFLTKPTNRLMLFDVRGDKVVHRSVFLEEAARDGVAFFNRICTSETGPYFIGVAPMSTTFWNMDSGTKADVFPNFRTRSVVTTQGKLLVSSCYDDHNVRVWDTSRHNTSEGDNTLGKEEEKFIQLHVLRGRQGDQLLTISTKEGTGVISSQWTLMNGRHKLRHAVKDIPFESSGKNYTQWLDEKTVFSRTGDGDEKSLSIVNLETWKIKHSCGEGNMSRYLLCSVVNSGKEVLAGSPFEQQVLLFSVESGESVAKLASAVDENCYDIRTDREGNVAVLHFHSTGLQVWKIEERKIAFRLIAPGGKTVDISYNISPGGALLFLRSTCSVVQEDDSILDVKANSVLNIGEVAVQCTLPEDLTFKSFIEDGSTLVTERDGLWSLWSSKSGEMLRQWKMPHILSDGMIVDATIDRRVLVLSSEKVKKSLGLVDVDQGKMVASFTFDKRIRKCALMNEGRAIAVIVDHELVTLRLVGNDIPAVAEFEEGADSKRPVTA